MDEVVVKSAVALRFQKTDFHCPVCGKRTVWRHGIDSGTTFACVTCKEDFYLNTWLDPLDVGAVELAATLGRQNPTPKPALIDWVE